MPPQITPKFQKRLKILEADEIEALYGRPLFTHDEQVSYFSLSPPEKATLQQLHTIKSRIYFILQLGYFKARQQFFIFTLAEVKADARYIQSQYFPEFDPAPFWWTLR